MLDELAAAVLSPGFAIYCGIISLLGLGMWRASLRETKPDWLDVKIALCRETGHRIAYAPGASLSLTEVWPRPPGIYRESICRCGLAQRVRWAGFVGSKAAQDHLRSGK